jgi:hypothetical protein
MAGGWRGGLPGGRSVLGGLFVYGASGRVVGMAGWRRARVVRWWRGAGPGARRVGGGLFVYGASGRVVGMAGWRRARVARWWRGAGRAQDGGWPVAGLNGMGCWSESRDAPPGSGRFAGRPVGLPGPAPRRCVAIQQGLPRSKQPAGQRTVYNRGLFFSVTGYRGDRGVRGWGTKSGASGAFLCRGGHH